MLLKETGGRVELVLPLCSCLAVLTVRQLQPKGGGR